MYHSKPYRYLRALSRFLVINRVIGKYYNVIGYEKKFNESLTSAIKADSVAWDIGANHGLYTDVFYNIIGPHGSIMAFEPNKDLASKLEERYRTAKNVHIFNEAVSNFSGLGAFELGSDELEATSGLVESSGTYQVNVKKLSDLVRTLGAPNVVKIDIEGAETALLDDILQNSEIYSRVVFFIEIHFALIEQGSGSKLFFTNLKKLQELSQNFTWIDASHLRFQI